MRPGEYFSCLYLGMVEELEAGGQGDILGVPAGIKMIPVEITIMTRSKLFFQRELG